MSEVVLLDDEQVPIEFADPFALVDSKIMNAALKKAGIKRTWELIKSYYHNEIFAFPDDFFSHENTAKFTGMFYKVYFFGKSKNPSTMLTILTKWCKLNWNTFHARNIEELVKNIEDELKKWNKENPTNQKSFINWIPKYGGKTD
jgi:hypothetical protein